jgi:uncharacterized iron-regulated membrane protein
MAATTYSAHDPDGASPSAAAIAADRASRRWRTVWRVHFYAGIFSMPFIVVMALTGLVILYTQPIQDLTEGGLRRVDAQELAYVSYDSQAEAVAERYPDDPVVSLTVPRDRGVSGLESGRNAYVDPYSGEVLGSNDPGGGIVGLANRIHGHLNNESVTISLPTVAALWDGDPVMRDYVVGDLALEILGCWGIVLLASGVFLWWPRKKRSEMRSGRGLFTLRLGKAGRARWRDLHAVPGVVLSVLLLFIVLSGMPWSSYWGSNFSSLANELTPNGATGATDVGLPTKDDFDVLGNRINWNTGDTPVPASYATATDGTMPAPLTLDAVTTIGEEDGMLAGYTVNFPVNATDEAGNPTYGSFFLTNSWPRKTGEARDLFLDQFTGEQVAELHGYGYGAVNYTSDVMVSTHMGTQLGVFSRIAMTLACVLALWAVASAAVMYWKRRRPGTVGLPRRPRDLRLANGLLVIALAIAIVYPLWGVSAIAVLLIDRFVIRTVPRLRTTFGQR